MKTLQALLFALAAASLVPAALAHTDEALDAQKAPNGGQQRMAGIYHFELVVAKDNKEARESPVVIHVTDHAGAKVSTVGAGGTATILAGKSKATVKLVPDGDNRLKGTGSYVSTADMKVVVSITFPGKPAEQARFTPLAIVKDAHAGHKH
ncbi:MAG: hypothetical protein Q8J99_18165 [Sulfuritalea sp.]|nr:hypothetical protein [Sulfuritalea sp.]